ncbi:MAG: primosomal protein N' [Sphingobacteriia bacterium]|nr:primosomal protein N' [Sphingobacteriia bacterium]NCC38574.1 primosomal protein N' [Gammaproteobacteria bacterium]
MPIQAGVRVTLQRDQSPGPILRVAIAAPLMGVFDYLAPHDSPTPAAGQRVLVPFRGGQRVGLVLALAECSDQDPARLKRVERLLDPHPILGPADLRLIAWAADYYHAPIGEALFSALPARLRTAAALLDEQRAGLRATAAGQALALAELGRSQRQRALLGILREHADGLALDELKARLGPIAAAARGLRARGLIETCRASAARLGATPTQPAPARGPVLNADQMEAIRRILAAFGGFRAFLLDGVTGSGKTEVYLGLIEASIARDRQTLLIVPEIGLTPQLRERLTARLPARPVVLHSALSASERERAWHAAAAGRTSIVIGTRSAVFVPMPRLGLILVDEEHDPSLKQQEGFRYSARDLAVRRAQLVGCPVVLGSATPALETLSNARTGRYEWLRLPRRAGPARPPRIALLDIRDQPLRAGLSGVLREAMRSEIAAGNQVLLFLNRRGYAPVLTCHSCGWVGGCPHCDARLTLHLARRRLWCHHCGWYQVLPERCPECRGLDLRTLGRGTERLDEELRPLFPDVSIARIDRDTTRRRGELDRLLEEARRGAPRILLGTQMLAKGHDFPAVTLVGILDLDHALYAGDFRAPERTAQLVVQVTGRAGRAERPGRVVLQTRHPDHPLLQSLLREGYAGFAELALAERQAADLPPYSHLALVRAEAPTAALAHSFLEQCRACAQADVTAEVELLGPVPAPMERRAGRYRAQLLVQSRRRPLLQRALAQWLPQLRALPRARGLRWSLDVDPQDMS